MAKLYGKGTVTEIEKGKKYRIELSAGKDPVTGKYRKVRETFLGTKRQAQLRIEEIRREVEQGRAIDADKVTIAEWMEKYLANRESSGKFRPNTLKRDRSTSKHVIRHLGNVLVIDLTPAMVNDFQTALRESGIGDTTVKNCHDLLKAIMKQAMNNDLILRNPVDRADTPKNPKPKRQALEPDEASRLANICLEGVPTANRVAVFLALATGARLGEVLGLTWGNVSIEGNRPHVFIVQQWTNKNELAPLKTDKDGGPAGHVVPIDNATVDLLARWKAEQVEALNELGMEQGMNTPVVTNGRGSFSNHFNFERWWRSFCVDNGFGRLVTTDGREIKTLAIGEDASMFPDAVIQWRDPDGWPCDENGKRYSRTHKKPSIAAKYDGLNFHALRHTHFTLRLASGMDLVTAQYLGGWSSPAMLMNVYAHPVSDNVWESAGFIDKLTAKDAAKRPVKGR